jgi:hypothetical protein
MRPSMSLSRRTRTAVEIGTDQSTTQDVILPTPDARGEHYGAHDMVCTTKGVGVIV